MDRLDKCHILVLLNHEWKVTLREILYVVDMSLFLNYMGYLIFVIPLREHFNHSLDKRVEIGRRLALGWLPGPVNIFFHILELLFEISPTSAPRIVDSMSLSPNEVRISTNVPRVTSMVRKRTLH